MTKDRTMRTLLAALLIATGTWAWIAEDAYAHGGQYRGPGGSLPPNAREGFDPQPPPPPPPSGQPPTTDSGTDRPSTPGAPTPVTPGGNPVSPATDSPLSPGTRSSRGKATITANSWVFWYEYNKDVLEDLKRSIYNFRGSRADFFGTGDSGSGARSGARHATRAAVKADVIPTLLWAIDPKNAQHQDVESAAYLALAKVTDDPRHIELIQDGIASKNAITSESCALALGMLRRERAAEQFNSTTIDSVRSFLFKTFGNDKLQARKRAFAAMAIGLLGDQPTGSKGDSGALATTTNLFAQLSKKYGHHDLPVSLLLAISMQPATSITEAQRDVLRTLTTKNRLGHEAVSDMVASYGALALGRIGIPEHDTNVLRRLLTSHRTGINVQRSAAIGLGKLGARASAETRREIASDFMEGIERKRIRDATARSFAMISLAYLVEADVRADETAVLGSQRVGKYLLEQAESGRYGVRTYAALALGLICRAIGDTPTIDLYGEFQSDARRTLRGGLVSKKNPARARAAYAVALGIAGDTLSIPQLAKNVANDKGDDELRGYSAIALGHIGIATPQVVKPILKALTSRRSEKLRQATATALGLLAYRGAVPTLEAELKSAQSQSAKGQIVVALAKVGDNRSIAPLVGLLRNTQEQELTRALACAGLGIVGDIAWIPTLSKISKDINYRASTDAINEVLSIL
jgi:HEAT repeat protein